MKKMLRKPNKQKAIDLAVWLNFKHRMDGKRFGVIQSVEGDFLIVSLNHPTFKDEQFEVLLEDYSGMNYKHIRNIGMDVDPLPHFEQIKEMVSVMDGEVLRIILSHKIPLEKFIRYELANRGQDQNHQWVGFDKAEEIWLINN